MLRRNDESRGFERAIISGHARPKTFETAKKSNENGLISAFLRETRECGYLATIPVSSGNLFHFMSDCFN
ncbi:hypothetical protein AGR9A_Cc80251 [Agrobacterium salinitolerans str. Hayward 0363]|nr:hypothetical protein AGR9A_Cc80251 [Agrobacterium salinitolerans str. Hayward 0363]